MYAAALSTGPTAKVSHKLEAVVKSIVIPPCPAVLSQLQQELAASNPDPREVARLVTEDVALSLAVLRTVNSPFYGLRRPVDSLAQAVAFIGLKPLATLVTSSLMRDAVGAPGLDLTPFWEVANQRSYAMRVMAQRLGGIEPDLAQSFGLFCDIGIPLLLQRFPGYQDTLAEAQRRVDCGFTEIEAARHGADHAQIGAIMARTWGLNDTLCQAIRHDHDTRVFDGSVTTEPAGRLIAMSRLADLAISRWVPAHANQEWAKCGDEVTHFLMLSDYGMADLMETLKEGFFSLVR